MASDQQFCLRWNNHQSTLVSVFDNLLESQTLVDCTLAADGQYLKAHKVVLSACSPYLEAILCQNLDKHPILILKDVKFSELKAMLDYMYRGEVNISQEQLSTFLKAAESLQIKGLTDSGGGGTNDRDRDPIKRQDLRKPLNQPVPHIPQPRPVVPHPGLMERRSLPHFPPHIADMQPQSPRHAREGSTSPTARKRRRPNRPSSDDSNFVSTPNSLSENQPDTSDSCDVPVKQAASSTPNVPNATTKAPETDSNRTTPQPQINQVNSEQKQQVSVKKEFTEALLTPKTEFDYGNDNSMEDVTYEDDEEEEVDLSKPGTSFAANSQGFPPWQMGGDGSNDDSNNMYSPDVTAATNQNNSQGVQQVSKPKVFDDTDHCVRRKGDKKESLKLNEIQLKLKKKLESDLETHASKSSKARGKDVKPLIKIRSDLFTDKIKHSAKSTTNALGSDNIKTKVDVEVNTLPEVISKLMKMPQITLQDGRVIKKPDHIVVNVVKNPNSDVKEGKTVNNNVLEKKKSGVNVKCINEELQSLVRDITTSTRVTRQKLKPKIDSKIVKKPKGKSKPVDGKRSKNNKLIDDECTKNKNTKALAMSKTPSKFHTKLNDQVLKPSCDKTNNKASELIPSDFSPPVASITLPSENGEELFNVPLIFEDRLIEKECAKNKTPRRSKTPFDRRTKLKRITAKLKCDYCCRWFFTSSELKQHDKEIHSNTSLFF